MAPDDAPSTESENIPPAGESPAVAPATTEEVSLVASAEETSDGDDGEDTDGGDEEDASEGGEAVEGAVDGEGKKKKKRRRKKKKAAADPARAHERAPFHVGEEVFGKVTAILETAIMVDLSGKALAIFDRTEMAADDLVPEVGERFVGKVANDGGRGGLVVLSRNLLREEEAKPKIEQAAKDGTLVDGLVTGVIKGGIEVLLDGLRAFAPASGVDLHPRGANLVQLVGQRLDFKVTTYDKQGREVVVTRRPMLEKEAHERRKKARETLTEGAEMLGVVRTIVDWGAFVALPEAEYLEGLVHASEVSHDPREKILDILKPGQKIQVKVQKIDEKGKIWLSRKALLEDPYAKIFENIKAGEIIDGEITRVEDFGAFVRVADGVEGLLHAADLGVVRVDDARQVLKAGEPIRVLVHHFDERQKRIALHPAPTPEQENEPKQKIQKGGKLAVEVAKIEIHGLHVRILGLTGRHARGYVPAAQTGTQRGAELKKHFNVGQKLEAAVVEFDPKRNEAKLSLSRLAHDEERRAHKEYQTKVKAESKFGTLGDLLKSKLGG